MFDAYPRQRINYSKVVLPLSLVALMCILLYAAFEFSSEDSRIDSEDSSTKRMRPFLSSQQFEIGLWTRQKGASGPPAATESSLRSSSPEVEELREELERARARSEAQAAELSRLKVSLSASSGVKADSASPTDAPFAAGTIPASLWREPPTPTTPAPPPVAPETRLEEPLPAKKDGTITVKTGDKEISIQIGKATEEASTQEVEVSTTIARGAGADDKMAAGGESAPELSTTQMATTARANATDAVALKADRSGDGNDGTLITVQSGRQSIVIQVRDGEQATVPEVTSSLPSSTEINTTLESPFKALPDLPELPPAPPAPRQEEPPSPVGEAIEKGDFAADVPEESEATATTKGFSAYANLALRTR